jgi:hypothetical protein
MKCALALGTAVALTCTAAHAADIKIPGHVILPQLEPLVPSCADPAADRFLEVDIAQRPPAGATRVQRLSAWVSSDGIFHWPFVMRVRNIGDQAFMGKPGEQAVVVTEDDVAAGKKGRVAASVPFDRIAAHSGVAVRFEFAAPAADVEKGKFHRTYTLSIQYKKLDAQIANTRFGDCNLRNNTFTIDLDGSRKGWLSAK